MSEIGRLYRAYANEQGETGRAADALYGILMGRLAEMVPHKEYTETEVALVTYMDAMEEAAYTEGFRKATALFREGLGGGGAV